MLKMKKLVGENSEQLLHTYRCQPHLLNLLIKDILNQKEIMNTTSKIIDVAKCLRSYPAALGELEKLGIKKSPMPIET